MDRACSEHGQNRNANKIFVKIPKWRRHSNCLGVNGKKMLMCIVKTWPIPVAARSKAWVCGR
jgi:hypothetical protein